jgi:hypothetical protein
MCTLTWSSSGAEVRVNGSVGNEMQGDGEMSLAGEEERRGEGKINKSMRKKRENLRHWKKETSGQHTKMYCPGFMRKLGFLTCSSHTFPGSGWMK